MKYWILYFTIRDENKLMKYYIMNGEANYIRVYGTKLYLS